MNQLAKNINPVKIEDEIRKSYLDYAMSVIVGRALPDARDGLKPVHRRVLYAMYKLNNDWNKAYKKSARVVGDVIGKYHPHGDTAVYDAMVRMAQPFSLRYMLVEGQGNFGSIDGDSPAAMRYTEVRMSKITHELLADIDKETVDFVPNYDGSENMPSVMPAQIPNLLINGSSGIAVGMATNIPPHNLGEVINGTLALLNDPAISIEQLIELIPGPDFPTAGQINGKAGIVEAYRSGRGKIYIRGKYTIESYGNARERLVFYEIPYQVNKARLLEKIAELVKNKKITSISELRDESDKDGLRIVIETKKGESAEALANNLLEHTLLQTVFGINMIALVNGRPQQLNLKSMLECFLQHRRDVVTKRTIYELRKARELGHILEGQTVALANIDAVISCIKQAKSVVEARASLLQTSWEASEVLPIIEKIGGHEDCRPQDLDQCYGFSQQAGAVNYKFSPQQVKAILELRLQKLTALEQEKLVDEYQQTARKIATLLEILRNPENLKQVIHDELTNIREQYADPRLTEITDSSRDIGMADLTPPAEVILTLSSSGYCKYQPIDDYRAQRRGGRGKIASGLKDDDHIVRVITTHTHDTVLCFSNLGKVYWLKVFQLPQGTRNSRGRPLVNVLPLVQDETITEILALPMSRQNSVKEYDYQNVNNFIFMATAKGTVKKTALEKFSRPRQNGIIAIDLVPGDHLIGAVITDGEKEILLFNSSGKSIRFAENDVRATARSSQGVRGMRMANDDEEIVSMLVVEADKKVLSVSEFGFGKCTPVDDFSTQQRGGIGIIALKTSERNGQMVGALLVEPNDEAIIISDGGTLVRIRVAEISTSSRNTQGVKLINLQEEEKVIAIDSISEDYQSLEAITEASNGNAMEAKESQQVLGSHDEDAAKNNADTPADK